MKKIIAFFKGLFSKPKETSKSYAEVKKEAKEQAEKIVAALDEIKAKKSVATNPAALAGGMKPLEEAPKAPAKKRKYYSTQTKKAK